MNLADAPPKDSVAAVKAVRLLILDRNPRVREALAARLGNSPQIEVVGAAADVAEGRKLCAELEPDVVVLDARSAGEDGLASAVRSLADHNCRVLVLSSYSDERERRSVLDSGALQYLLKDIDSEQLIRVIEGVE